MNSQEDEKNPSEGSWITDEVRAMIGKEVWRDTGTATLTQIKKFAQCIGDKNSLYFSEHAKSGKFDDMVAPPLFDDQFLDYDGREAELEILQSGSRIVQVGHDIPALEHLRGAFEGEVEYELFKPIRPGDVINASRKVMDVYEKVGRSGRMVFIVGETTLRDEQGETVLVCRSTVIRMPAVEGEGEGE